jgi:hypothetical protein
MGVDPASAAPGQVTTAESSRRLRREQSYGYIRALWWMAFADGRMVVSVPPGAGAGVEEILGGVSDPDRVFEPALAELLKDPVDEALHYAGLAEVDRVLYDLVFACNAHLLRRHRFGRCERIRDPGFPTAAGAGLPSQCFPDGVVYGVIADGKVVSVAFAHRTGIMEDRLCDVGVGTAAGYRGGGFAKTCVSALVEHYTRRGGEARYACSPDNEASIATASSVGFAPYGRSLTLSAPRREEAQ